MMFTSTARLILFSTEIKLGAMSEWKEISERAAVVALCVFGAFLFLTGQFRGANASDNIGRSIVAMIYIVVPTSALEVIIELAFAFVGTIAVEFQLEAPSIKRMAFVGVTIWLTVSVFFYYFFPPT